MKLLTKGRYALRAMLRLSTVERNNPLSLQQIAQAEQISVDYLNQLFFRLRKAGLVESVRGPGGGFLLSRDPNEITAKEVFDAVGEEMTLAAVTGEDSNARPSRETEILANTMWQDAAEQVRGYFSGITLQGILDDKQANIFDLIH